MGMVKRLATYYVRHEEKASELNALLETYNLTSLKKDLDRYVRTIGAQVDKQSECILISAEKKSDEEQRAVLERNGIPANVSVEAIVDPNLLEGITIYYDGKKWNDSARGKLKRFIT